MFDLETIMWTQNQSNNMQYRFQTNENSFTPRELNVIGLVFRFDYGEETKEPSVVLYKCADLKNLEQES